ncbi:Uncharacterised protein [Vibrio cholerae]|nr:Uncharacterised protein [Vibrio cholerae]
MYHLCGFDLTPGLLEGIRKTNFCPIKVFML